MVSTPERRSGPTRRTFLRGSLAAGAITSTAGLGGGTLAFVWPNLDGVFGGPIRLGDAASLREQVTQAGEPLAIPSARCYLVAYDPADDPDGVYEEIAGGSGLLALFHTCVHLGCRVPFCASSGWFECPCHNSQYDRWGEYRNGPAGRGLDRFPLEIDEEGVLIVDTSALVTGPPRDGGVLDDPEDGPHCTG